MTLLLDTHALLWWMGDDARLGPVARGLIADPRNDVVVSIASLWEIVVKVASGKLEANLGRVERSIELSGFSILDIRLAHLETLTSLPPHHRDPFDRMLIAQAISEPASLVSQDAIVGKYPVLRIPCS